MTVYPPMNEIIPVLRSPLTNLDSLVSFYQQERMWIRRTRAELQDSDDDDEGPSPRPSPTPSPELPSPKSPHSSRWIRRKKDLKLKLAALPRRPTHSLRVLDMYESIMQSRMESCQRINRLIRNANRAHLSRITKRYSHSEYRGTSSGEEYT
ncbi:uncharacterized protein ARMOST_05114 [Armillaria ostoyae]|uniref:Uncharacterized protein n=1 Tax=Armillaria ostoyae TaxID=47428 RepID=A0A284QZA3_ARMOS|nr:uncharacterized protein ARMOST_05114 [Armillaria ostoyae]